MSKCSLRMWFYVWKISDNLMQKLKISEASIVKKMGQTLCEKSTFLQIRSYIMTMYILFSLFAHTYLHITNLIALIMQLCMKTEMYMLYCI